MATFENVGLALQLVNNIHGLVRDMRDNANGYKAGIQAGKSAVGIAAVMIEDADQYLRRIQWVTDVVARNQAAVVSALSSLNLLMSEVDSLNTTLSTVSDHTKVATLSTDETITTEADYILATVPDFERIF